MMDVIVIAIAIAMFLSVSDDDYYADTYDDDEM